MSSWIDDAKKHLIGCWPNEGCGLLVGVDGVAVFLPVPNAHEKPENAFRMNQDAYGLAEDNGEILGVVHSHVDRPAAPSDADRAMCEGTQLPWHIFRVDGAGLDHEETEVTEQIEFAPSNFLAPLVGRKFVHGIHDCYAIIRDYYKLHRGVDLPNYERPDDWWEAKNDHLGLNLYEDLFQDAGFVEVDDGTLLEGDVILMQVRSKKISHAGVYLGDTDGRVLHHLVNRLSTRDVYGGYWADVTRKIVRYQGAPS